jgi:hypothetical protein
MALVNLIVRVQENALDFFFGQVVFGDVLHVAVWFFQVPQDADDVLVVFLADATASSTRQDSSD